MVWLITTILRPNNRPCSGGTHVLHGWRNSRPKSHQERSWPLFWFFFWNMGGIFVSDCLLKGQIVLAEFYSNLLCWLKNKFKKKKKKCEATEMCSLLFARQCTCSQDIWHFEEFWVSATLLTRSCSIYFLFPNLKTCLKRSKLSEMLAATEQYFSDYISALVLDGFDVPSTMNIRMTTWNNNTQL